METFIEKQFKSGLMRIEQEIPVAPTLSELNSVDGVHVLCTISSGERVYVPLKAIVSLLENEILSRVPLNGVSQ